MGIRGQHKNKRDAVCAAPWCNTPRRRTIYCGKHYSRLMRLGSISANLRTSPGMMFLRGLCKTHVDECIEWPFFINPLYGYPILAWRGKQYRAHRVVCRLSKGKPAEKTMHAAHGCGNKSCVNPSHLRWATAKENIADKEIHGTKQIGSSVNTALLSEQDVLEVLNLLKQGKSCAMIGRKFEVSRSTISKIKHGINWGHLSGISRKA